MRIAFRILSGTFLFLALCLAFASNASADSYVLTFDGQKIDVNSVRSVMTSQGEAHLLEFNFDVGQYSAQFYQDVADGTHIDELDLIEYLAVDGRTEPYEKIVLTDDYIYSIAINSSGPNPIPTEDVDIAYSKVTYAYLGSNPGGDGGTGGGTTNTPEPSTLALLAAAMGSLVLFSACKKH